MRPTAINSGSPTLSGPGHYPMRCATQTGPASTNAWTAARLNIREATLNTRNKHDLISDWSVSASPQRSSTPVVAKVAACVLLPTDADDNMEAIANVIKDSLGPPAAVVGHQSTFTDSRKTKFQSKTAGAACGANFCS